MTIGQRIKQRRKELGLSADEVAEKLNKNRATVYRYENGDIGDMPISVLEPLSKVLQTTPADLLGWYECEISDTDLLPIILENQKLKEHIKKLIELNNVEQESVYNMIDFLTTKKDEA